MTDEEAPNDEEVPDEEVPNDEPNDEEVPDDERLDQVQDHIDSARKTAEDADVLIDPDEPRFYKSGDESDEDDQTIAPPG